MRKTTTVHSCDRCGGEVERPRDLRRFDVFASPGRHGIRFDLCRACEDRFVQELAAWANVDASLIERVS